MDSPAAVEHAVDTVRAVREAVDDDIQIGIDFHGQISKPLVKHLASAPEPYDPMFYEEPVLAEHNDTLGALAAHTDVLLATGERMFSRWDFKSVLAEGTVDIVQPDLSHAGGITECKKIADMAEAYDVAVAPHCPLGPDALAACIQVDACAPNALVQEQTVHRAGVPDWIDNPEVFDFADGGYVPFPEKPGLGVEIDVDTLWTTTNREEESWKLPRWLHDDGSVAEW